MKLLAFLLLGATPLYAEVISLAAPVAQTLQPTLLYYSFDEVANGTVADLSGGGHDAVLAAGTWTLPQPTASVSPAFGEALLLEGGLKNDPAHDRNPYVVGREGTQPDLSNRSFTLGLWVRIDDDTSRKVELFSKGVSSTVAAKDAGITLALDRQEEGLWRATLQIRDGQGANPTRGTGYELEIPPGHWVHLGVSFDHEARSATFFWNGEVKTVVQIPANVQPGSEVFILGERRTSSYVSEFRGAIDDFFITEGLHEFAPLEGEAL